MQSTFKDEAKLVSCWSWWTNNPSNANWPTRQHGWGNPIPKKLIKTTTAIFSLDLTFAGFKKIYI